MLNEHQEEELAEWWREHPGLYGKSNETYRRKAKKDRLIAADKAEKMRVQGFDARMLAGWMKGMRTMYGKEDKLTSRQPSIPSSWQGEKGHGAGKLKYLLLFI